MNTNTDIDDIEMESAHNAEHTENKSLLQRKKRSAIPNNDQLKSQLESFKIDANACSKYIYEYTKNVNNFTVFPNIKPGYLRPNLPSKYFFFVYLCVFYLECTLLRTCT